MPTLVPDTCTEWFSSAFQGQAEPALIYLSPARSYINHCYYVNRPKGPDLHPHERGFLLGLSAGGSTPSKIFHAYRVPESTHSLVWCGALQGSSSYCIYFFLYVRTATRSSQWWYVTKIQLIGSKSVYSGESYFWVVVTLPRHAMPK